MLSKYLKEDFSASRTSAFQVDEGPNRVSPGMLLDKPVSALQEILLGWKYRFQI